MLHHMVYIFICFINYSPLRLANLYTQDHIILNNNRLKTASLNKKLVVWSFGRLVVWLFGRLGVGGLVAQDWKEIKKTQAFLKKEEKGRYHCYHNANGHAVKVFLPFCECLGIFSWAPRLLVHFYTFLFIYFSIFFPLFNLSSFNSTHEWI